MGIGIALGGAAEGFLAGEKMQREREELALRAKTISQDAGLRSRAIDIQEKQESRLANQDLLSRADKIIGDQLGIVGEVIKAGKEAGHSAEKISAAIEPILKDVDRLSAATGRDSGVYRNNVAGMLSAPTAAEAAAAEGAAEGTRAKAKAEASGVPLGTVEENIKRKIAAGEPLTEGENRLYQDSVTKSSSDLADLLNSFSDEPAAPAAGGRVPAQGGSAQASAAAVAPPLPANLQGKGAKWSPSKQRWFMPDGSSFNQQGVPVK